MKKIFSLLFSSLLFFAACNDKTKKSGEDGGTATVAQNSDYPITMDGIGPIKVSMSQEELEKLLNQKVPLANLTDTVSGSWEDSATIKYKEAELRLGFVRTYMANDSFYMRVTGIKTSSPLCKTTNGLGIGSGKQQIIDAYESYLLFMAPEYEDTTYATRSKTRYSIKVRETYEGGQLVFYLTNNKVTAIEASTFYDDSE